MIAESLNTEHSYRKSLDDTKSVLKFATEHPISMAGHIKYNHEDILVILSGPEWTSEEV